jgi:endonuclease/exonuclease/phosphatase family metal-dependent hydrolase
MLPNEPTHIRGNFLDFVVGLPTATIHNVLTHPSDHSAAHPSDHLPVSFELDLFANWEILPAFNFSK